MNSEEVHWNEVVAELERRQKILVGLRTDVQPDIVFTTDSAAQYFTEAVDLLDRASIQLDLAIMKEQEWQERATLYGISKIVQERTE